MYLNQSNIRKQAELKETFMGNFEKLNYDELKVFTENGEQYCIPVWASQSVLNVQVLAAGASSNADTARDQYSASRKFPLISSFNIPDGVYSAYLFKVCEVDERIMGVNVSHYQYKGKNPAISEMNFPTDDCPFDEILPVPKPDSGISNQLAIVVQAEAARPDSIQCRVPELGQRNLIDVQLFSLGFNFQRYIYN